MFILGVNGEYGHDASACLVEDGNLVAYSEEERTTRIKHAPMALPINAIGRCLYQRGIVLDDVSYIASSTALDYGRIQSLRNHVAFSHCQFPPIVSFDHHQCHISAAYHLSGFKDAVVLVIDGQGDSQSATIAYANGQSVKILNEYDVTQSLGYFYTAATYFLGMPTGSEGKFMGLASYGMPRFSMPIRLTDTGYEIPFHMRRGLPVEKQAQTVLNWWQSQFYRRFGEPIYARYEYNSMYGYYRQPVQYNQLHKDFAASVQKKLEQVIIHLIRLAVEKTNCQNVVVCGGVFLNCSLNGQIEQSGVCREMYVFPAVYDAGTCIGAAFEAFKQFGTDVGGGLATPYWEQDFSDAQIKEYLDRNQIRYTYSANIAEYISELLVENQIVAWFQGRGEMGPRALGNRSIIANPMYQDNHLKINLNVKNREPWRPFAPSILNDHADFWFDSPVHCHSPYMLKAYPVKPEKRHRIPAVVHVDGSARPQTVAREDNEIWYELIDRFYQKTGVPMVLNTSLNGANQPISNTPHDAVMLFYQSSIQTLVLNNFYINK